MTNIKTNKHRKAKIGGKLKIMVTIRNWIHQGFFYLDRTEMFFRVIWELIPFSLCFYFLTEMTSLNRLLVIFISGIVSHTLNWIFNDNFWTCIMFTFPKVLNPGEIKTIEYLSKLQERLNKKKFITGCMIYGSLSRNEWKTKSDLDMRVLREPGVINGLLSYLFVFKERVIAVIKRQPLDLYLADNISFLRKMRKDEFPIFLKNNDERLYKEYKTKDTVDFKVVSKLNGINIK